MTGHTEDEAGDFPRGSFLAFLRDTDPNLFAWEQRTESTDDLRLASAMGELTVAHELFELARETPGLTLREGIAQWLAGYHALRRRRDSFRLLRALARERASNPETNGPNVQETP